MKVNHFIDHLILDRTVPVFSRTSEKVFEIDDVIIFIHAKFLETFIESSMVLQLLFLIKHPSNSHLFGLCRVRFLFKSILIEKWLFIYFALCTRKKLHFQLWEKLKCYRLLQQYPILSLISTNQLCGCNNINLSRNRTVK